MLSTYYWWKIAPKYKTQLQKGVIQYYLGSQVTQKLEIIFKVSTYFNSQQGLQGLTDWGLHIQLY